MSVELKGNCMIQLELLDNENEKLLLKIERDDIPTYFVEEVSYTIELSKYGDEHKLKGHCYAIKFHENHVGIILIGEAIEEESDPSELKGTQYFRIIGFVIDKKYRKLGIGAIALQKAIANIYYEYGDVPIVLECHKENQGALDFYIKTGFRNTNILHNDNYYFIKYSD